MNVWISVSLMLNRLLVVSKDCRDPQTVGKPKLATSILQNYSHLPVSFLCKRKQITKWAFISMEINYFKLSLIIFHRCFGKKHHHIKACSIINLITKGGNQFPKHSDIMISVKSKTTKKYFAIESKPVGNIKFWKPIANSCFYCTVVHSKIFVTPFPPDVIVLLSPWGFLFSPYFLIKENFCHLSNTCCSSFRLCVKEKEQWRENEHGRNSNQTLRSGVQFSSNKETKGVSNRPPARDEPTWVRGGHCSSSKKSPRQQNGESVSKPDGQPSRHRFGQCCVTPIPNRNGQSLTRQNPAGCWTSGRQTLLGQ